MWSVRNAFRTTIRHTLKRDNGRWPLRGAPSSIRCTTGRLHPSCFAIARRPPLGETGHRECIGRLNRLADWPYGSPGVACSDIRVESRAVRLYEDPWADIVRPTSYWRLSDASKPCPTCVRSAISLERYRLRIRTSGIRPTAVLVSWLPALRRALWALTSFQ